MNYIKVHFSGVTQYYSSSTAVGVKGSYATDLVPTKTAVIGLLSAALGYERGSSAITELTNAVDVKYLTEKEPIILSDYQTVRALKSQQYYMNKHYSSTFKRADGGKTKSTDTLIKKVEYLQDGEFSVYIGANSDQLLQNIYEALKNPVYSLYFGKRCCVPNKPLVTTFELIDGKDLVNVSDCI